MILTGVLLAVIGLGLVGWFAARGRARLLYSGRGSMHSMSNYHGWHMALWIIVPALIAWTAWSAIMPGLVDGVVMADPAAASLPATRSRRRYSTNSRGRRRPRAFMPTSTHTCPRTY